MTIRGSAVLLGLSAVVLVLGADHVTAQRGAGSGQGPAHYDVTAEKTVTGTVEEVRQVTDPGPWAGTHVTLKTAAGTLELALGPSRFMTQKKYTLAKGDQIEVIGATSKVETRDVLVVREIKRGSDTMTFRDAKGVPMWSGARAADAISVTAGCGGRHRRRDPHRDDLSADGGHAIRRQRDRDHRLALGRERHTGAKLEHRPERRRLADSPRGATP